jgi:hypothetical protein
MSETTKQVTLPSDGRTVELPELSTEQVLQLIRLAKGVLNRVPDLMETVNDARIDYLKGEAQGFVSKAYYEGLSEEEQTALTERLSADFQEWTFYEDLSSEDQEAISALDITPETLKQEPIQFSFPSEAPMLAVLGKVFPEVYDACANEIIMAVAVTMMPAGRLEKAVKTNTVEAQLLDYRAELTQKLKPADFIHLAAEVVAYVIGELRDLGGPLGETLKTIQSQLGGLVETSSNEPSQPEEETPSSTSSETSDPASSSSSPDPLLD